ncbi:CAAX prenyl protease-related protein [Pseudoduganella namucuonensis]|uniref:CAAX prenyl protease 2/Lysostaphin resistance protein A-like domain-containing protein n=1 Tax=Pseudoduganella namucuonensis TaxID=1035707 RepID=A0A1I7I1E6_9BURK|nr:CAAX prenyl protease-related protein [Pseudoduganella namucuonensis]SFU66768.1 hypothetical protein SAMN05216552_100721 [Pseudoduganella namucuonensis]
MTVKPYLPTAGPAVPSPSLARILPFATYLLFILIADVLGRLGYGAAELRWLYAVKVGAVLALLLAFRHAYTELAWTGLGARWASLSIATGLVVFALWITLGADWMRIGASPGFDPRDQAGAIDWGLAAARIAGAALVVPVMEELFWRSFLQRWLAPSGQSGAGFLAVRPAAAGARALLITSVAFGFEHDLWLAGIVAGLAYGLLYMRSGNLWTAILAHAVTNGVLGVWIVASGNWQYW